MAEDQRLVRLLSAIDQVAILVFQRHIYIERSPILDLSGLGLRLIDYGFDIRQQFAQRVERLSDGVLTVRKISAGYFVNQPSVHNLYLVTCPIETPRGDVLPVWPMFPFVFGLASPCYTLLPV